MQDEPKKTTAMTDAAELKGKRVKQGARKRANRWLVLLIALAVALATGYVVFLSDWLYPPAEVIEEVATSTPISLFRLIDRSASSADCVTITRRGETPYTLVYTRDEVTEQPRYVLEDAPYFRVDQAKAQAIGHYAALMLGSLVEEGVGDLSVYGLQEPSLVLQTDFPDGTRETVEIGDRLPTGSGHYARRGGERDVYSLTASVWATLNQERIALHAIEMPAWGTPEEFTGLRFEPAGAEPVELKLLTAAQRQSRLSLAAYRLVDPVQHDANDTRVIEMIDGILAIVPERYVGYAQTPETLSAFGLTEPRLRLGVTIRAAYTVEIAVGSAQNGETYIMFDGDGVVYALQSAKLAFAQKATVAYLVDQFSNLVNILQVDALSVSSGAETFDARIERIPTVSEDGTPKLDANGQQLTQDTYFYEEQVTRPDTFKKLYQLIIGARVDRILDDYECDGEEVATVVYRLKNGIGEWKVSYLAYDSEYYVVRAQDSTLLFLIKRAMVDQVLEACRAYRDGTFDPKVYGL